MPNRELPDITDSENELSLHAESRPPRKTNNGYSLAALMTTSFLTLLFAAGISLAFVVIGKDTLLLMVGVSVQEQKQPDKVTLLIEEQKAQLIQLSQLLDEAHTQLANLSGDVDANALNLNKVTLRVTTLETFTSGLETKIAEHQKTQQVQVAAPPKRIAQPKPKAIPVIPLVLLSIRSQSGTTLVALRDGFDTSELLIPGDSWHGWTLLEADPTTKIARFKVAGKVQELRL